MFIRTTLSLLATASALSASSAMAQSAPDQPVLLVCQHNVDGDVVLDCAPVTVTVTARPSYRQVLQEAIASIPSAVMNGMGAVLARGRTLTKQADVDVPKETAEKQ